MPALTPGAPVVSPQSMLKLCAWSADGHSNAAARTDERRKTWKRFMLMFLELGGNETGVSAPASARLMRRRRLSLTR
jgi:hypothetical protein